MEARSEIAIYDAIVRDLLKVSRAALRSMRGTNIMGGCPHCGSTGPNRCRKTCIVRRLRESIREAEGWMRSW